MAVSLTVLVGAACQPLLPARPHVAGPAAAFGHQGRWFTDGAGRVVMPRGVNFVEKWAPFTPEADAFDDDAALLAENGFNTGRLGVVFEFLMPEPGRIDRGYLESNAGTVSTLGRHDLSVLHDLPPGGGQHGKPVGPCRRPDAAVVVPHCRRHCDGRPRSTAATPAKRGQ